MTLQVSDLDRNSETSVPHLALEKQRFGEGSHNSLNVLSLRILRDTPIDVGYESEVWVWRWDADVYVTYS